MKKSKKGFTLIELMIVALIISVLAAIGLPQYRAATRKTRIAAQLPMMKALQDDIINFYNLNGGMPTSIYQLSLNRSEFEYVSEVAAHDPKNNCDFRLQGNGVEVNCQGNWKISFAVNISNGTIRPGNKRFTILNDNDVLKKAAESFGWQQLNEEEYEII